MFDKPTATNFLKNWRKGIPMIEYKEITLSLAEEDIADQTDYIAFELKSLYRILISVTYLFCVSILVITFLSISHPTS